MKYRQVAQPDGRDFVLTLHASDGSPLGTRRYKNAAQYMHGSTARDGTRFHVLAIPMDVSIEIEDGEVTEWTTS